MLIGMSLPLAFSKHSSSGLVSGSPVSQFELGDYLNFVYLVVDWALRRAAIVDPQSDLEPIFSALASTSPPIQLTEVWLTHTHHDHIAGLPALGIYSTKQEKPLILRVHADDATRLDRRLLTQFRHEPLSDEQKLTLADHEASETATVSALVLHTPGHSAGESCFLVTGPEAKKGEEKGGTLSFLLTGDTLFIGNCGRTDLPTGSDEEMFLTLQRLKTLPPDCIVLPGHHYSPPCASTLEQECRTNPALLCRSLDELKAMP